MKVEVTGVGMHPFGRFEDRSVTDMGVQAVRAALGQAGNPTFQAAFCGTAYSGVAAELARRPVGLQDFRARSDRRDVAPSDRKRAILDETSFRVHRDDLAENDQVGMARSDHARHVTER